MSLLDPRTGRVILTLLLIAAGLAFVWLAWQVLAAFLFAIFFAYLIDPVVQLATRRLHLSRGKAILAVYVVILGGLGGLVLFVGPAVVQQAEKLAHTLPDLYQKVASGQIAFQLGAEHGWSYDTRVRIQQFLASHNSDINSIATDFATRLARIGRNAWWLLLIPILAVFFLKDGEQFRQHAIDILARRRQREFMQDVANDVHLMLAHYIRAQLIMSGVAMAAYVVGLVVLRVPYGAIMGVIGGLMEFIPIVGPFIASLLMIGVALGSSYHHVLVLVLYLGAWRILQDYVNAPHLMGNQLRLHPLATLFGILAGAEIAGIIGVYLSVPIMATFRILWRRWQALEGRVAPIEEVSSIETPQPSRDLQRSA